MTALTRYQRLECLGIWRETPQAQRRDVVVSFGNASLILSDSRSDIALTHWSLPAVERLNPGSNPALYSPAADRLETLEIEDASMIDALATVHRAIESQRFRPGRLRFSAIISVTVLAFVLGVFWMPGALVRHAAQVVPASKRAEIGRIVLADMNALTGAPCTEPAGLIALTKLRDRVLGPGNGELVALMQGFDTTRHLPGGVILIARPLIEDNDSADIAAGYILAEQLRDDQTDPMIDLLNYAGLRATFRLLTTGDLPANALIGYGAAVLNATAPPPDAAALLERFAGKQIPAKPYALAVDPTGLSTKALIDGDPSGVEPPENPVMPDGDWVSLQGICQI